jgi:hypothetical protein
LVGRRSSKGRAVTAASLLAAFAGALAAGGIVELAGAARPGRRSQRVARVARAFVRHAGAARRSPPGGLAARVDAAGVNAGVGEVMAAKLGAVPVAALAALTLLPLAPGRLGVALLVGAPFGAFFAPDLWLQSRARARALVIEAEQADVLDLLRVAVGAGLGPWRALAGSAAATPACSRRSSARLRAACASASRRTPRSRGSSAAALRPGPTGWRRRCAAPTAWDRRRRARWRRWPLRRAPARRAARPSTRRARRRRSSWSSRCCSSRRRCCSWRPRSPLR